MHLFECTAFGYEWGTISLSFLAGIRTRSRLPHLFLVLLALGKAGC